MILDDQGRGPGCHGDVFIRQRQTQGRETQLWPGQPLGAGNSKEPLGEQALPTPWSQSWHLGFQNSRE